MTATLARRGVTAPAMPAAASRVIERELQHANAGAGHHTHRAPGAEVENGIEQSRQSEDNESHDLVAIALSPRSMQRSREPEAIPPSMTLLSDQTNENGACGSARVTHQVEIKFAEVEKQLMGSVLQLKRRRSWMAAIGTALAALCVAASVVENELLWFNDNEENLTCSLIKAVQSGICAVLAGFVVISWLQQSDSRRCRRRNTVQLVLSLAIVPPFTGTRFQVEMLGNNVEYHIDNLNFVICLAKFISWLLEWIAATSRVSKQPRLHILGRLSGVEVDSIGFILKDWIHRGLYNAHAFFLCMVCTVFTLAYLHRLAERSYPYPDQDDTFSTDHFWNSLWFIFVTASTVGYGSMVPVSHCGRTVAVLAFMAGIVFTSLLVESFCQRSELSLPETKIGDVVGAYERRARAQDAAVTLIALSWKQKMTSMSGSSEKGGRIQPSEADVRAARDRFRGILLENKKVCADSIAREPKAVADEVKKVELAILTLSHSLSEIVREHLKMAISTDVSNT